MHYWIYAAFTVVLHELAHLAVALSLCVRVKGVGISLKGPYIIRDRGKPWENLCIALAAPIFNLFLAAAYWSSVREFAVINLVLGVSNILPIFPGCDGQNALAAYRQMRARTVGSSGSSIL